jgi:tRNA(His) 5'-end guanylyltransferase
MKRDYENRTRYYLPRRTYTLLRIDGKSFHNYTRGCQRPFDSDLMADMDTAALGLCENIDGAKLAFVQSDEISVLLTDFASQHSEAWFDGNLQKIASVSASITTAHFNAARAKRNSSNGAVAYFDCRVWTIPARIEVFHYFLWRQNDATRNSISMTAQAHFPHGDLQGKKSAQLQEMLWRDKAANWNDLPSGFKRGRVIERVTTTADILYTDSRTGQEHRAENISRHRWEINIEPPIFSQDRGWLLSRIPGDGSENDRE